MTSFRWRDLGLKGNTAETSDCLPNRPAKLECDTFVQTRRIPFVVLLYDLNSSRIHVPNGDLQMWITPLEA